MTAILHMLLEKVALEPVDSQTCFAQTPEDGLQISEMLRVVFTSDNDVVQNTLGVRNSL